jgi:hypothetical protein
MPSRNEHKSSKVVIADFGGITSQQSAGQSNMKYMRSESSPSAAAWSLRI